MKTNGAEALKSYLLGHLDEPRREELEQHLLNDGEFFEELLISEDELVDNYVAGRLNDVEKKRFESHFLITPERHRKFQFGLTLNKYLQTNDEANAQSVISVKPRSLFQTRSAMWPIRKTAIAFSLIAVLGVASFVLYRTFVRTSFDNSRPYVVSLVSGGGTRSAGSAVPKVSIPAGTGVVEFRLAVVETNYQSYIAEISPDQGSKTKVRSSTTLQENGERSIVISLPADSIPPNDYRIELSGIRASGEPEFIDRYVFRVQPQE